MDDGAATLADTGWDLSGDPRAIWTCWQGPDRAVSVGDTLPPDDAPFRWLHLDLWMPPTLRWLERHVGLPASVGALFTARDAQPSAVIEQGWLAAVLPDFQRDFQTSDTGHLGTLHLALGPATMLTGRHHPLHTPDVIRHRAAWSATLDPASSLELVLGSVADTIAGRAQSVATELLTIEDQLLADEKAPDTRQLVALRRLSARLHRMTAGLRLVLIRLDGDPALPDPYHPVLVRQLARLQALEAEVAATQGHLRLLREELDLQAGQRTNENVYLLSVVTVLLMPATLVTGFFGMNTEGLPFAHGPAATVMATISALGLSGLTFLALRAAGLVRR